MQLRGGRTYGKRGCVGRLAQHDTVESCSRRTAEQSDGACCRPLAFACTHATHVDRMSDLYHQRRSLQLCCAPVQTSHARSLHGKAVRVAVSLAGMRQVKSTRAEHAPWIGSLRPRNSCSCVCVSTGPDNVVLLRFQLEPVGN